MDKVKSTSVNTGNENLDKLRRIFPQFIKENKIDFDALNKFFKDEEVIAGEEKYGLNWAGKSNAFKLIRTPSVGTLTPQEKVSRDWDRTENLFIEGDNLEVLKLLQKHYREKIKMIYIDPPYNTGKDFIYKDNYTENISDYYEKTGQSKNGIKMTTNPESAGRYHSDWLTMMYPRLFLARNLLKEDGVIFISIDDNEVANLRLIMDEIFGEENFYAQINWTARNKPMNAGTARFKLQLSEEYILVYGKITMQEHKPFKLRSSGEKNYPFHDEKGLEYRLEEIQQRKNIGIKRSIKMEFEIPGAVLSNGYRWTIGPETAVNLKNTNRLVIKNAKALRIIYSNEENNSDYHPLWANFSESCGTSENGKAELFSLLENSVGFETVKPVDLLKKLVFHFSDTNDNVLDFFAGSGTTAHAVMELNAEDGGNRKWICVQLPEATDEDSEAYKAGYKNIAEIARERIRRAGKKIVKGDIDFKSLTLSKSNYRQWNLLTDKDDQKKLKEQMKVFLEKPLVDNYDEKSVVYEILLKEGYDLNSKVTQEKSGSIKYWQVVDEGKKLLVTFEKKITKEQVESLKLTEEDTFVCLDSALDDTTKINIGRNLNVKVI